MVHSDSDLENRDARVLLFVQAFLQADEVPELTATALIGQLEEQLQICFGVDRISDDGVSFLETFFSAARQGSHGFRQACYAIVPTVCALLCGMTPARFAAAQRRLVTAGFAEFIDERGRVVGSC